MKFREVELRDRMAQDREERDRFRTGLEAEFSTTDMPQSARDLIWRKAWEDGHSSGLTEVRYQYDELADIAKASAARKVQP